MKIPKEILAVKSNNVGFQMTDMAVDAPIKSF